MRSDVLQLMRGSAALAVVLAHSCQMLVSPEGSFGAHLGAALINTSTIFVFIAGYVFQQRSSKAPLLNYAQARIIGNVLPYIIISIPALIIYGVLGKKHPWLPQNVFEHSPIETILHLLMTGQHLGPLWFMPMLFLFFAAAPAFQWIDKRPHLYWVIALLLLVSLYVPRADHDLSPVQAFVHFLPAYLIGMASSRWKAGLNPFLAEHAFPICTIGILCTLIMAFSPSVGMAATLHLKIPVCFALLAFWLRRPEVRPPFLSYVGNISFGLYLLHGYVVGAGRLLKSHYPQIAQPGTLQLLIGYALVLGTSIILVELTRHLAGPYSKIVIGLPPSKQIALPVNRTFFGTTEAKRPNNKNSEVSP